MSYRHTQTLVKCQKLSGSTLTFELYPKEVSGIMQRLAALQLTEN